MKLKAWNEIIENAIQSEVEREMENNPERYDSVRTSVPYGSTYTSFSDWEDGEEDKAWETVCYEKAEDIADTVHNDLIKYLAPEIYEDEKFFEDLITIIKSRG